MSDSKNWREGGRRREEHDQCSSSGSSIIKRRCDDREESSRSSDSRSHHRSSKGQDQDESNRGSERTYSPERKFHRKRRSSPDRTESPDKRRHSHHRDRVKVSRRDNPERESEKGMDRRYGRDRDNHNGRRREAHEPYYPSERRNISRTSRSGNSIRGEDKHSTIPHVQEIPKSAGNTKLVEEVEKRKLLFSKKEKPAEASSSSVWEKTKLSQDSDGKLTAKFKRLMGIKDECSDGVLQGSQDETSKIGTKKADYFADLEKQYEVARVTTHTQRGVGLGFSTSRILPR